ncbi:MULTISPECIES: hypothetical protein [Microcystis]|uniref:hypothetical protein n=1 Tax=Microcystis TaxID=1125 RepID=UPI0016566BA4|nr:MULTISPECIES: hypothetical protein [Microcystis]MCZ8240622.1 hypothetical protein [Microcystis sp. LE19-131.1A]
MLARLAHIALKPTTSIHGHGAFPKIDRWSSGSHIRERTLQDWRSHYKIGDHTASNLDNHNGSFRQSAPAELLAWVMGNF